MCNCCFLKIGFFIIYKAVLCSLISLGVCCIFWLGIGGSLPTYEYETGGYILFTGSVIQTFFFLLCLLICKRELQGKCPFIFVEIGLLISLACACNVFFCFQNFHLNSSDVQEYSVEYFKQNGRPPPFMSAFQKYVPCCGVVSFDDYCYIDTNQSMESTLASVDPTGTGTITTKPNSTKITNLNPSFSVPTSCCSKSFENCTGHNIDRILLMLIDDIEQRELDDFLANFTYNSSSTSAEDDDGEELIKKYISDFELEPTKLKGMEKSLIEHYDEKYKEICESVVRKKYGDELERMTIEIWQGIGDGKNLTGSQLEAAIKETVKQLAMEEFFKSLKRLSKMKDKSWNLEINVLGCGTFLQRFDLLPLFIPEDIKLLRSPLSYVIKHREKIIETFFFTQLCLTVATFLIFNLIYCCRLICNPPRRPRAPLPAPPPPPPQLQGPRPRA